MAPNNANVGFGTPSEAMYSAVCLNCGILLPTALNRKIAAIASRATSETNPCTASAKLAMATSRGDSESDPIVPRHPLRGKSSPAAGPHAGSSRVMQCRAPRPRTRAEQSTGSTRRPGKQSPRILRAGSSVGPPNTGTATRPLATR